MKSGAISAELRRLGRAGPNVGEMELLRAATLSDERAASAWRRWLTEFDIDDAYHRSTDLLPMIVANLDSDVLGDDRGRLNGIRRRLWADNQFGFIALGDAVAVLDAAGIAPVLAKGAALATTVYRKAGTRAMADVDLIVGPGHFDRAVELLVAAGWRRVDAVEGPFFHAVALANAQNRQVDVHRWVMFPRFTPVPEQSWLDRAVPHQVGATHILRLTSSDELVLAVLHGLLTNSSSASRWPVDVVLLSRAIDDPGSFWAAVIDAATELQVGPVVADALAMCAAELDAAVPAEAIDDLRAAPLDRGLAVHWALCRRGVTLEWRMRRYARIARSQGRTPSPWGYVGGRAEALRTRGMRSVVNGRVARVRQIVTDRTRR